MSQIDRGLQEHFAANKLQTSAGDQHEANGSATEPEFVSRGNTFAKVNTVETDSPAQRAGLRPGDRIEKFGDANWLNNEKLSKVAHIVTECEGVNFQTSL